jgi:hypothetical protein
MQAAMELERKIRNASVSCLHYLFSAFVDDLQTQVFGPGFIIEGCQDIRIKGGTFSSIYSIMQAATELERNPRNPFVSCTICSLGLC